MILDTDNFTQKLLEEKALVEKELATVARRNPENKNDWEPTPNIDERPVERDEVAEKLESFEENIAIARRLEAQLAEVNTALDAIKSGSYGKCSVCGNEIESARLDANPSATTCKAHMK